MLRSWRGSLGDWGAVALVVRPVLEPEWAWMCHRPDLPLSELLLDALASPDFKMSLSEWVSDSPFSNFTASASTGLSELFLNEMKRSCWWKFNFFSYCTERGWWCWCEWGMLLCKEVPKKGRPGSKKLSSQHCKRCSLSCNFTTEAFVKTSTWDHMGLAPSTRGRWIPQSQLWWAEIFSFFWGGEVGTWITFSESYHISLYQFPPQKVGIKKIGQIYY